MMLRVHTGMKSDVVANAATTAPASAAFVGRGSARLPNHGFSLLSLPFLKPEVWSLEPDVSELAPGISLLFLLEIRTLRSKIPPFELRKLGLTIPFNG